MTCKKRLFIGILALMWILTGCESKEERAAAFVASGNKYRAEANPTAAKIEFNNALQLDPHNLPALAALSELYEQDKQLTELSKTLNTLLQLDENNQEARLRLVNLLAYVGSLDKALAECDKLLTAAPDNLEALLARASLLFRTGRETEAVTQTEQILQRDAGNISASLMLASYLLGKNQHPQALQVLQAALAQHPDDRLLNLLKINAHNALGQGQEAVAVFTRLVKREPADLALHQAFVRQYLTMNDAASAEQLLADLAGREKSQETHLLLVQYLYAHKGAAAAEAQLRTYIRDFPDQPQLRFSLVDLYLTANRRTEAKTLLQELVNSADTSDRLRAKNVLAHIAGLEGDLPAQTDLYRQVLAADPKNTVAIVGLAHQDLRQKNPAKAVEDLRAALAFAPDDPEVQLALAQAYELIGQSALAQEAYLKAVQIARGDERFTAEYARFLVKTGEWERAEKVLEGSLGPNTNDAWLLGLMAQIKLHLAKWDEAQTYAQRLEQLGADKALVSQLRGATYMGMGKYDESLAFFEQAQQDRSDQFRPMASLVGAYLRAGRRNDAENFLKSTLETQPDSVYARVLLGVLYEHLDELPAAEGAYRQTLEMQPDFREVYRRLAAVLVKQDKLQEGLEVLRDGREKLPQAVDLAVSEAVLLEKMGRVADAMAVYRKLIQTHPESEIAYNNLATLLVMGDDASQREALKIAERFRNSEVPHFQDTLGWVYLKTGNKIEGLYLLEKAAKALKDNAEVRYHLGMAYLANERRLEAKRELEFAVQESGQPFAELDQAKAALAGLTAGQQ